ncbi:MAG: hypothetical protein KDA64_19180 [Rhodospirillaceae bacterium]|nr:hypothetical protein [Rhodospirillaceae bacterium]
MAEIEHHGAGRRGLRTLAGLALAGVLAAAAPAHADTDTDTDTDTGRLADLLASVPADIDLWEGGEVTYCDLSIFVPTTPHQLGRLATLPQNVYAAGVATEFADDRLREVAGLPWSALTGLLSFGRVPEEGRVFILDAAAMAGADPGGALDAAGFARADPDTGPVYWVLADGEAAFELNTVFRPNPLLPDIPVAIRVAPLEDRIATARTWPVMEAMLDVHSGTAPALGDHPAVVAALAALEGQGEVVQALFATASYTPEEMADLLLESDTASAARPAMVAEFAGDGELRRPYELMLLADLTLEPLGDAGALVLVYGDGADAQRAAADLDRLWADGVIPGTDHALAGPAYNGRDIAVLQEGDRHVVRMVLPSPLLTGLEWPMFRHLMTLYMRAQLPIMVAAPRSEP